MDPWMAVVLVALFGIGIGCGVFMGRNKDDSGDKIKKLEGELADAKSEMDGYRQQVGEHFGETAELFNKMTSDYRDLYQHLAGGAQQLCDSSVPQIRSLTADDGKAVLEGSAKRDEEEVAAKPEPVAAAEPTASESAETQAVENEAAAQTPTETEADKKAEPAEVAPSAATEGKAEDRSDAARTIH